VGFLIDGKKYISNFIRPKEVNTALANALSTRRISMVRFILNDIEKFLSGIFIFIQESLSLLYTLAYPIIWTTTIFSTFYMKMFILIAE